MVKHLVSLSIFVISLSSCVVHVHRDEAFTSSKPLTLVHESFAPSFTQEGTYRYSREVLDYLKQNETKEPLQYYEDIYQSSLTLYLIGGALAAYGAIRTIGGHREDQHYLPIGSTVFLLGYGSNFYSEHLLKQSIDIHNRSLDQNKVTVFSASPPLLTVVFDR